MSDKEILERAIQKAIDGGWTVNDWTDADGFHWEVSLNEWDALYMDFGDDSYNEYSLSISEIIYQHDFAKALWPTEHDADVGTYDIEWNRCTNCGGNDFLVDYCWQYHLMNIAITDDQIKYLGDNLPA